MIKNIWPESSVDTLRRYEQASKQVKSGIRIPLLSWSHHVVVSPLATDEQAEWSQRVRILFTGKSE